MEKMRGAMKEPAEDVCFEQLGKNTVQAKNQLEESAIVHFDNPAGSGKRILFMGNSITLHGVSEKIGWYHAWGMAASDKDKDYVHILMREIRKLDPDAAFCICQVSEWETSYKEGSTKYRLYENARRFQADIIVMRFIENCPGSDFDAALFKKELAGLLAYVDPQHRAAIILTTGFWRHPGDAAIAEYGRENHLPVVVLGDLGEDDRMKAIGLFEHTGVANHPGDLGMQKIAERILDELRKAL